eukprot:gene13402-biopygen20027
MWQALKDLRAQGQPHMPCLEEDGKVLSPRAVLKRAEDKWGKLYQHPDTTEDWCGAEEWEARLREVRRTMATGRRVWTEILPPTWEEFRAYVKRLPTGKSGAGVLRYEMFKQGGERELRVWYEQVVLPAVHGTWDPVQWLKEGILALIYKKEDGSSLNHFRGIGLLSHAFKIIEWAILASVWRRIVEVIDAEIYGFVHNRGTTQALWRIRSENDYRTDEGDPWVWLSLDMEACFDMVLRELGLAAGEGLGIDPEWGTRWRALWKDLGAVIRVGGHSDF